MDIKEESSHNSSERKINLGRELCDNINSAYIFDRELCDNLLINITIIFLMHSRDLFILFFALIIESYFFIYRIITEENKRKGVSFVFQSI